MVDCMEVSLNGSRSFYFPLKAFKKSSLDIPACVQIERRVDPLMRSWFGIVSGVCVFTKSLHVKANGGSHVQKGFFVGITLPHYNPFQAEGVANVAVLMFFDDEFDAAHGLRLGNDK